MADPNPSPVETSEQVLATEIGELEKRTLNSGWIWAGAAVGLMVLLSAAFLILSWDRNQSNAKPYTIVPEAMVLKEPLGSVDRDLTFRWNSVEGAASYVLMVTAHDRDEVELLRPVRDTFLKPSETELSNFNPGSYAWTIDARNTRGQVIGYGEASFTIAAGN